jgi:hypothetical protein
MAVPVPAPLHCAACWLDDRCGVKRSPSYLVIEKQDPIQQKSPA